MTHCPICAPPISETSTGITVGNQSYHSKYVTTLQCDDCCRILGYMIKRVVEGHLSRFIVAPAARNSSKSREADVAGARNRKR